MRQPVLEADVIVAGSGPGGAAVAKELSTKKKVVLLEWGSNGPLSGSFRQGFQTMLRPGKCLLVTPQRLSLVRGITAGGSTVPFYAVAHPVPLPVFKAHGVDLAHEVEEIKTELPVAPLKEEMVGPMARRIRQAALDLGYAWKKLDKFMYQDRWKPSYPFGHWGDPTGVKWTAREFISEATANGARFVDRARVTKVLISGNTVEGVEFKRSGRFGRALGQTVVLAAGGIGTPLILRASGIRDAGHDFFFDPLVGVRGTVEDIEVPLSEIPMAAGIHFQDEGCLITDMSHPLSLTIVSAAGVHRFGQMFTRRKTLQIMVKARDDLGGTLTDRGGVRKLLSDEDQKKLDRGCERAVQILKKAGAKDIFRARTLAAHPGGTAEIGDIVDSNLMTRFQNLYVCDCSVIPGPWGLPPTLTIIALAKRLARHLLN